MTATPASEEWKAARTQIEKLDRQKNKRVPDERHEQRMSALYVDAVSFGRWNALGLALRECRWRSKRWRQQGHTQQKISPPDLDRLIAAVFDKSTLETPAEVQAAVNQAVARAHR
jgi:hypothetical protein